MGHWNLGTPRYDTKSIKIREMINILVWSQLLSFSHVFWVERFEFADLIRQALQILRADFSMTPKVPQFQEEIT